VTATSRLTFHHDLARVALLGWAALGALLVSGAPPSQRPAQALGVLAVGCLLAAVGWCPALRVDDDGVTVVNPWRTTRLHWDQVTDVRMGWALTLTTRTGPAVACWACPGPRRMQSLWDRGRSEGGLIARHAPALLDAQGGSVVGLGDAGIVVLQRLSARPPASVTGPAAAPTTAVSRTSRALLATAVVLAAAAVLAA
jgi:hypothetical protein